MNELIGEAGYLELLNHIKNDGEVRSDRTGTGTRSIFGGQLKFDLRNDSFPLLTTKRMFYRGISVELMWFLSGSTHAGVLQNQNVHIWDEWATKEKCAKFGRDEGDLGPIYGHQWRKFGCDQNYANGVDQISKLMDGLKNNPFSRRHIVSSWDPKTVDSVELPPCHTLFQFYVSKDYELSCHLYQRSADMFLGVPFNIASYALLTHMIAKVLDYKPGWFVQSFGDAHIYENHIPQVETQLKRFLYPAPKIHMFKHDNIFKYRAADFTIIDYNCHPALTAKVAI